MPQTDTQENALDGPRTTLDDTESREDVYSPSTLPAYLQKRVSVDPKTGCWHYNFHTPSMSHDLIRFRGRQVYFHRLMYEGYLGPLPSSSYFITHLCGDARCGNPAHLVARSRADIIRNGQKKRSLSRQKMRHVDQDLSVHYQGEVPPHPWTPSTLAPELRDQIRISHFHDCWVADSDRVTWRGRRISFGRLVYAAYYGTVEATSHLFHRCRSTLCVNPYHLGLTVPVAQPDGSTAWVTGPGEVHLRVPTLPTPAPGSPTFAKARKAPAP